MTWEGEDWAIQVAALGAATLFIDLGICLLLSAMLGSL